VGGIVNLRTRKPFDAPGHVIAFSGDYNYADLRKKGFWSGNVLASNRWSTGLGEIGVLLSYSVSNIGNRTDQISDGRFDRATLTAPQDGLAAGTNVYIPAGMGFRQIDWQQRRTAFDGSIQWKDPSDTLVITGEAFLTKATPHDLEFAIGDYNTPEADNPTYQFGEQHQLISGVIQNRFLNPDTRYGHQTNKTRDFSGNLKWTPNDHWAFGADLQYIKSSAKVVSMTAFDQTPTTATDCGPRWSVTVGSTSWSTTPAPWARCRCDRCPRSTSPTSRRCGGRTSAARWSSRRRSCRGSARWTAWCCRSARTQRSTTTRRGASTARARPPSTT